MRFAGLLAVTLATFLFGAPPVVSQQNSHPQSQAGNNAGNLVHISSGDIRLSSGTVLHLDQFDAASIPRLDQQGCKHNTIQIHSGRISLTDAGLTQLINHGLEKKGDKKRIKVTAEDGKLKFEGNKAAGMSMTFEAKPTALGDSRIALMATDVKMGHLPVKGLLHTFGFNMDDLMHPKDRALSVDKDNIIVDLRYVSKETPLEGRVTSVVIEGQRIVVSFGNPGQPRRATTQAAKLKANKSK